ncbi:NRDE family protein [Alcaligenaceae bacterium A4P071]|nr:NRDE family protein [Alcaligenaceae bacterium A4P071]
MCLATMYVHTAPGLALLVAANRDEFQDRPTRALAEWPDAPGVFAGRDAVAGGTWMGATRSGRFALVTNYREPGVPVLPDAPSRGALVGRFLQGTETPEGYMGQLTANMHRYAGFNLVVGDANAVWYVSNRGPAPRRLPPGRYVLSNHLLDSPWPKSLATQARIDTVLAEAGPLDDSALFSALRNRDVAHDDALPHTGLSLERERLLSSAFIISPTYGTRASTVYALANDGHARYIERRYDADGEAIGEHIETWQVQD